MTATASEFPRSLRQIWLGYARATGLGDFIKRFPELISVMGYEDSAHFLDSVQASVTGPKDSGAFSQTLNSPTSAPNLEARELLAYYYLRQNQNQISREGFSEVRDAISPKLHSQSPWIVLLTVAEANHWYFSGEFDQAQQVLDSISEAHSMADTWGVFSHYLNSSILLKK